MNADGVIDEIMGVTGIQPILVDIGASDAPPPVWDPIARHAIYIGFDPDARELRDVPQGKYARSIVVNMALTSEPGTSETHFYFTRSPYCSSTLPPDTHSLASYLFSDLFAVEREASVPVTSLSSVLQRLDLPYVDWFKTDSQGTDLRLFQSLPDDVRMRVLAVDVEPGLIDAYRGEDLFVDAHRELLRQGFWLSSLDVKGSVRMERTTLQSMARHHPGLGDGRVEESVRPSPGWCESRYLRTLESLQGRNAHERDYVLLWAIAMIERQWGYALDIAGAHGRGFPQGDVSSLLRDVPLWLVSRKERTIRSVVGQILPSRFKSTLRRLVQG